MQKICINKEDNMVNQIFDLSYFPEFKPEDYPYCYVVDDEDDKIKHYGYKYNLETKEFEEVEGYEEPEVIVEPSKVEVVEKKTEYLETELYLTQSAVDFLLMSTASEFNIKNIKEKGENNIMAGYLSMRIIKGMLSYADVVTKYPEYKEEIDFILKAEGKGYLITI